MSINYNLDSKQIEYAPKSETILLFGGLTLTRERILQAAAASVGEEYIFLPNATYRSYELGKMYGNKAQCSPTYFTVGNLIKYLIYLRDEKKIPTKEIIRRYVHVTANGCGPCRFGMYITEYKKALRDAGFDGFRVVSFEHNGNIFQEAQEQIVKFSPKFFIILTKAAIIADILTILGDKLRPYELNKGEVDKVLKRCEDKIVEALKNRRSLIRELYSCRKELEKLSLNRVVPKPKVMVMGEFWAAMTRSDGNYQIHKFLEEQGAEVISQPLINRILLNIWEAEYLREQKEGLDSKGLVDFSEAKKKTLILGAKYSIRATFNLYAKAIGLKGYELANMDYLYKIAKDYYPVDSNGGEGHLEVAHLLEAIKHKSAHLVVSVKPFGCMPSSGVSDGIQSLVTSKFKDANFISLETSGDGAVNFYSRLQMALFKAKQSAKEEFSKFKLPSSIPSFVNRYNFEPKAPCISTAAKIAFYLEQRR
ncbi:MAG: hypothetical protein GXN91_04275 [Epsilonproteobacteria bacterium]|nr:hypothetical protein [Campylobacterota bacterium]